MVLGRTHMIVCAGPLTPLATQVARSVNMESMITGREPRELGNNFDTGCHFFKRHLSMNRACVKHCHSCYGHFYLLLGAIYTPSAAGPVGPVGPLAPLAPLEPSRPGGPAGPSTPSAPFVPGRPSRPGGPAGPGGPGGPGGPATGAEAARPPPRSSSMAFLRLSTSVFRERTSRPRGLPPW